MIKRKYTAKTKAAELALSVGLQVGLTEKEFKQLEKAAGELGLNVSKAARQLILDILLMRQILADLETKRGRKSNAI